MASSCRFALRLLKMRITPATSGSMAIHSTSRSDSEIPYVHPQFPDVIVPGISPASHTGSLELAKRCPYSRASKRPHFLGSLTEISNLNLQLIVLVFPA